MFMDDSKSSQSTKGPPRDSVTNETVIADFKSGLRMLNWISVFYSTAASS